MSEAAYTLMTAFCRDDKPVCCDCGGVIIGQSQTILAGTLLTCANPNKRQDRQRLCGRHSLVVPVGPMGGGGCSVIGLSQDQFATLRRGRFSWTEALEYLGLLVVPVKMQRVS